MSNICKSSPIHWIYYLTFKNIWNLYVSQLNNDYYNLKRKFSCFAKSSYLPVYTDYLILMTIIIDITYKFIICQGRHFGDSRIMYMKHFVFL